jgi:hypothetical protein
MIAYFRIIRTFLTNRFKVYAETEGYMKWPVILTIKIKAEQSLPAWCRETGKQEDRKTGGNRNGRKNNICTGVR